MCKEKYYFPDPNVKAKYFNGSKVEAAYFIWKNHSLAPSDGTFTNLTDYASGYECLPCKYGCDTCEDDTPCFVEYDAVLRGVALGIQTFCMTITLFLCVIVFRVRKQRVRIARGISLLHYNNFLAVFNVILLF